jgi:hypothetical protein
MTRDRDRAPNPAPRAERDPAAEAAVHSLLVRLAGLLPDRLLNDARDWLAEGRRLDVVQAVAFAALSKPFPLDDEEIGLLRSELARSGNGSDLAEALEELRGERIAEPSLFLSAVPVTDADAELVVQPRDLTGQPAAGLDPVDQALVSHASAVAGVRAVWRAWRMPPSATTRQKPVRVTVVSVDDTTDGLPALTVRLRQVMTAAGDPGAQVEVCRAGLNVPFYQTLARSCGALLWAVRPAVPITTARVFDGVDPMRGPWFAANRPVVADRADRDRLIARLRSGLIISWSSTNMTDVVAPECGDVVPLHFRTDGSWVWSEAVGYYVEHYHLAPDPALVAHLNDRGPAEPLDEISLHRALVHLCQPRPDEVVWQVPGKGQDPVPLAASVWP